MDKLVRTLGITGLSKSQVSEMAKDLDEHVDGSDRPLAAARTRAVGGCVTMKVRENGRVVKIGHGRHRRQRRGVPEILGGPPARPRRKQGGWRFRDLVARGLTAPARSRW